MAKYSVNDAIWVATALMAAEVYEKDQKATREDMFFKQADIVHRAQEYTDKNVDAARVSWWVNADNVNHTQNYLRADLASDPTARRLTMMKEFSDKTYPTGLNMADELTVNGKVITMADLFGFVREKYPSVLKAKQMSDTAIDYIGVLKYLEENCEIPYYSPDKTIDASEKAYLLEIEKKGQYAVGELEKMIQICQQRFGLVKSSGISWLDSSKTKTRKYLWAQMKYGDIADDLISISIFTEMRNKTEACYRISLEIKNDGIDRATMDRYHSHLDLPLNQAAGLVYVTGSNEWGRPGLLNEDREVVQQKVKDRTYRKVQVCRCIDQKPNQTNEYFEETMLNAVEALLPYYNHVVGKRTVQVIPVVQPTDAVDDKNIPEKEMKTVKVEYDKNMILYGPPGTGKTYSSAIYAVAICDDLPIEEVKGMNYSDVMDRYDQLKNDGRIAFTTFHQSYGYEEFIEGIKPVVDDTSTDLGYTIEPGVFKRFCENARTPENYKIDHNAVIWCVRLNGKGKNDLKNECFKEGEIRFNWGEKYDNDYMRWFKAMKPGDYVVSYYGSSTDIDGIGMIEDDEPFFDENKPSFQWTRNVEWLVTDIQENVKAINGDTFLPNFEIAKLRHMKISDLLKIVSPNGDTLDDTSVKPYVFVIDEINRGNISKIFGELITLIEDTKREGMEEHASAILPYSGEIFAVPQNVYILGTMNTADRSIALMDTALRRRFRFVEMLPEVQVLRDIGADHVADLDVAHMLEVINERITFLYDREHTIGHAFFTKLSKSPNIQTLAEIFRKSVIPLLQEYFYEDYQKIQFVLGDNGKTEQSHKFILDEKVNVRSLFKGEADEIMELPETKYTVNAVAFENIESYKEII